MNLSELQKEKARIEAEIEKAKRSEKPKMPKEKVKLFCKREGDFFTLYSMLQNKEEMEEVQKRQFELCGCGDSIPETTKGMLFVLSDSGKLIGIGGGWIIFKHKRQGFETIIEPTPTQLEALKAGIFPRELFEENEWTEVVD